MAALASRGAVLAALDCRTCDGSGHGDQLSVDSFGRCSDCNGTGHAGCDFCGRSAYGVIGRDSSNSGDFACEECHEELTQAAADEERERRREIATDMAIDAHLDEQRGL